MASVDGLHNEAQSCVQIYLLTVNVIRAEDLKAADLNMSSDPFVEMKCNNDVYKTKVIQKNLNPRWDEQHLFCSLEEPKLLDITVWDEDEYTQNDLLGTCEVNLKQYFDAVKSTFEIKDNKLTLAPKNEKDNIKNATYPITLDVITDKKKNKTKGRLFISIKCEKLFPLETELRLIEMLQVVEEYKLRLHQNEELYLKNKREWENKKKQLENNLLDKSSQIQNITQKYDKLSEDFRNLENHLKSTIEKFENEIRDLKQNLSLKNEENKKFENENRDLKNTIVLKNEEKTKLENANRDLNNTIVLKNEENSKLENEKKSAFNENTSLKKEVEKNLLLAKEESSKYRNVSDENLKLNAKIQENNQTITNLNNKFNEESQAFKQQIKNQEDNVRELHETINSLQNQINELQQQNTNGQTLLLNNNSQKQQPCCVVM